MSVSPIETNASPVKLFIVGSARSGTSITFYAAHEVLGLKGRGEGHAVPIFFRLNTQFQDYATRFLPEKGTLAKDLDAAGFRAQLLDYVRAFYRLHYGDGGFVDKTPGAESIRATNFILEAFPDARILATRRTGIEVVQSYRLKFNVPFINACKSWVDCMQALSEARKQCPGMLEVDQYDLTNAPEETGARIANHIGRPGSADALARFFVERRVEQSSEHDWTQRLTLDAADWKPAEKDVFRTICGATMAAFNYPL